MAGRGPGADRGRGGGRGRRRTARRASPLGAVFDSDDLAELRALTTTGDFLDDIYRCRGSGTVALPDAEGEFIGSGSHHGRTDTAWERGRFRNSLQVADPEGLLALLERHGGHRR
ncbi:hypothetical protein ACFYZJ_22420 [Streptomyces sp. NPDC001848]|uniref:hypothetical protein n=1 Tax=Streptomyces sp. NPDC001848 TaxID=3364618 RepID=UPI0036D030A5